MGRILAVGGLTTLATERILSLDLTTSHFLCDPDLELHRLETEAFGVNFEDPITVVVRIRPDQAPYVREREWHPSQRIAELPDGAIELTLCAGGAFEIERWILGWGDAAEVIAPEWLRARVWRKCKAMLEIYKQAKKSPALGAGLSNFTGA